MNLLSPSPFWPIRDGLVSNYPCLESRVSCDVAILGAGVSGALAALHLAEAGLDTVVLDRRDVAHGSTAGSTSLLQYEIDEPLHKLALRYGRDHAVRSYRRCRDAIGSIENLVARLHLDCGFERKRSLLLASGLRHVPGLQREFICRRDAGFAVAWWSQKHLASASSLQHPAAILSRDGAQMDAYRFTHGLLAAAQRAGARVFDRTRVSRTRFTPRGVELHIAGGGQVTARHLVAATGYEADTLLPEKITTLQSTFAVVSEPTLAFTGWPADRCLIWETANPYVYLRTTEDNRVILGGFDEPFRDPVERDRLLGAKTAALKRRFHQLFPDIPMEVAYSWAGTFGKTIDGLPYIGRHPKVPHTWFALGYGGNGITFSLIAAESIRDQILGGTSPDTALFGFDRQKNSK